MSKNVKPFAVALIAAFSATPVLAADLTYSEPAPSYSEPTSSKSGWTGAYVGAHAGIASRKFSPFNGDKGFNVGVQGGYNMDLDSGVVGAELEASHMGNAEMRVPGGVLKERGRVAAKAKAGVGFSDTLVYGTAGIAMTDFKGGQGATGPDGWKFGYIVGAGVEQKLSDKLSAKVEYNYGIINDVRSTSGGVNSKTDVRDHTLKAGVNYRF